MLPDVHVIIPAAGSGQRLRAVTGAHSKNLLSLNCNGAKTPLVAITVARLKQIFPKITLVVSQAEREIIQEAVSPFDVEIVLGGETRQESVYNGLCSIKDNSSLVAIHDAARPLVSHAALEAVVAEARQRGAAVLVERVTSTLKQVEENGRIISTFPRENFSLAQTPQVFRTELIREAHEQARIAGLTGTDDAQLVEALGVEVFAVINQTPNPKITTPEDIAWAEFLFGKI